MSEQPINVARFQDKVRAIFGTRGENPIPSLRDLQPVVVIENDRPDWSFAGREVLAGLHGTRTATVGQNAYVALRNPVDSGMLVVVKMIREVSANEMRIRRPPGALTGVTGTITGAFRDFRHSVSGSTAAEIVAGQNAASIAGLEIARLTGGLREYIEPIVLPPGSSVVLESPAQNVAVEADYAWVERALERGLQG